MNDVSDIRRIYELRAAVPFDGKRYSASVEADVGLVAAEVPRRDAPICDVGCGAGWHLEALATRGYTRLVGIDLSSTAIASLQSRIGAHQQGTVEVHCGDVRHWRTSARFQAVTCFLSNLGSFGPEGDEQFVSAIHSLLMSRGVFISTVFCADTASQLCGKFAVRYSEDDSTVVRSAVTYEETQRVLSIAQSVERDGTILTIPTERIRLFTRSEIRALLARTGFGPIRAEIVTPARDRLLIVAQKA